MWTMRGTTGRRVGRKQKGEVAGFPQYPSSKGKLNTYRLLRPNATLRMQQVEVEKRTLYAANDKNRVEGGAKCCATAQRSNRCGECCSHSLCLQAGGIGYLCCQWWGWMFEQSRVFTLSELRPAAAIGGLMRDRSVFWRGEEEPSSDRKPAVFFFPFVSMSSSAVESLWVDVMYFRGETTRGIRIAGGDGVGWLVLSETGAETQIPTIRRFSTPSCFQVFRFQ